MVLHTDICSREANRSTEWDGITHWHMFSRSKSLYRMRWYCTQTSVLVKPVALQNEPCAYRIQIYSPYPCANRLGSCANRDDTIVVTWHRIRSLKSKRCIHSRFYGGKFVAHGVEMLHNLRSAALVWSLHWLTYVSHKEKYLMAFDTLSYLFHSNESVSKTGTRGNIAKIFRRPDNLCLFIFN
jgi:hypothetical protein